MAAVVEFIIQDGIAMRVTKIIISVLLCVLAVLSFTVVAFAEEEETTSYFDYYGAIIDRDNGNMGDAFDVAKEYMNPKGTLLVVSNKGDWANYPENSLEGILSAFELGADIVKINVKRTADGQFVLMHDESTTRTCYGGDDKLISELTLSQVKEYRLLSGVGEEMAKQTAYTVPSLYEVLASVKGKGMLLIDFKWEWKDELYSLVNNRNMLGDVIFYTEAKAKEIGEWTSSLDIKPHIMSGYKSNIVFAIGAYIKDSFSSGVEAVRLATKNPYGVIFDNFTMKKFGEKGRAVIDMTNPKLCGDREDTEKWWDDVVSRGYSIIITDYPEELAEYAAETEYAKSQLRETYKRYKEEWTLPEFGSYTYIDYKRNYQWAVRDAEAALNGRLCSKYDYLTASHNLRRAAVNIEINYTALRDGKAELTISLPRIIVAILAVAAVVGTQVYFYKKRKREA